MVDRVSRHVLECGSLWSIDIWMEGMTWIEDGRRWDLYTCYQSWCNVPALTDVLGAVGLDAMVCGLDWKAVTTIDQ